MGLRAHLVIFTRAPRYGAGKRRLEAGIGPMQALRFQRVMLTQTLRRLGADPRWTTWLAVTPDRSGPWPPRFDVLPQGKGDLGARMARVAKALPAGPVLIMGSDVPWVTIAEVARAFRALGNHDAVFLALQRTVAIGPLAFAADPASLILSATCGGRRNMRYPTVWRI